MDIFMPSFGKYIYTCLHQDINGFFFWVVKTSGECKGGMADDVRSFILSVSFSLIIREGIITPRGVIRS